MRSARALGTIAAFEIASDDSGYLSSFGPRLLAWFRDHDVLLRPLGNTVYVMPPYCIDHHDLDRIYRTVADACEAAWAKRTSRTH